jgi:hypothetical protein
LKRSPETKRLLAARKAAAADLGLPESDWRVRRFAVLSIAYEGHEEMLASGRGVDAEALLKLDEAMQAIRASIPPPRVRIELTRSHGPFTTCPECGWSPPPPEAINREGESVIDGFRRMATVHGGELKAQIAIPDVGATLLPEKTDSPSAVISGTGKAGSDSKPAKPYHETALKDSRPNAPAPNGGGSVVWFGITPHK